jgi:hypothetical protein
VEGCHDKSRRTFERHNRGTRLARSTRSTSRATHRPVAGTSSLERPLVAKTILLLDQVICGRAPGLWQHPEHSAGLRALDAATGPGASRRRRAATEVGKVPCPGLDRAPTSALAGFAQLVAGRTGRDGDKRHPTISWSRFRRPCTGTTKCATAERGPREARRASTTNPRIGERTQLGSIEKRRRLHRAKALSLRG